MRLGLILKYCQLVCWLLATPALVAEPCWLSQPVTSEYSGYIGVAEKFDSDGSIALASSRRSALRQLYAAMGDTMPQNIQDDKELAEMQTLDLQGQSYYFAKDFVGRGAVFSYISTGIPSETACAVNRCRSERCEPSWLCGQSADSDVAEVLGVGEWRISDKQQWMDAVKSASDTAAYWGITDVSSDYRLLRASAAQQYLSFVDHDISVDTDASALPPLTLVESCRDGSTLYQRWLYERQAQFKQMQQRNAAMGRASVASYTAAGTLQSVIDLAIRKAYADLAQNKDVRVKTIQKTVSGESAGRGYSMEAVSLTSHHRLSASLSRLSITPRVGKPYVVEVELLENTVH